MQNIKTQFGFTKVADGEKQPLVSEVFSSVASSYDVMNDAMSMGVHRLWKQAMVDQMRLTPGLTLLDVASGTGDIVKLAKSRQPSLNVISTDINADMLGAGRRQQFDKVGLQNTPVDTKSKSVDEPAMSARSAAPCKSQKAFTGAKNKNPQPGKAWIPASAGMTNDSAGVTGAFNYTVADGSALPFASSITDRISIAFGIRNIPDIPAALKEFHRCLKPGGKFVCMEFSKPSITWLETVYDSYSFNVIPWLGEKIGKDKGAYQYLVESIRTFPTQDQFASMIREAGFERTSYTNLSGGIVAIHSGVKI